MRTGLLGLLLPLLWACSEQTISPIDPTLPAGGLCVYPRACYLAPARCDCVGGPARCREGIDGGALGPPRPTDPGVACPSMCALPEAVCVARGPRCDSYCVRSDKTCETGARIAPQRAPADGGSATFCPFTDDICCPGPAQADMTGSDAAEPADAIISG